MLTKVVADGAGGRGPRSTPSRPVWSRWQPPERSWCPASRRGVRRENTTLGRFVSRRRSPSSLPSSCSDRSSFISATYQLIDGVSDEALPRPARRLRPARRGCHRVSSTTRGKLPPAYWRLWTASAVSNLGDGIFLVALPLLAAPARPAARWRSRSSRGPAAIAAVAAAVAADRHTHRSQRPPACADRRRHHAHRALSRGSVIAAVTG